MVYATNGHELNAFLVQAFQFFFNALTSNSINPSNFIFSAYPSFGAERIEG